MHREILHHLPGHRHRRRQRLPRKLSLHTSQSHAASELPRSFQVRHGAHTEPRAEHPKQWGGYSRIRTSDIRARLAESENEAENEDIDPNRPPTPRQHKRRTHAHTRPLPPPRLPLQHRKHQQAT
jgi:hypothetical protein